jgi:hypothetical protein
LLSACSVTCCPAALLRIGASTYAGRVPFDLERTQVAVASLVLQAAYLSRGC